MSEKDRDTHETDKAWENESSRDLSLHGSYICKRI